MITAQPRPYNNDRAKIASWRAPLVVFVIWTVLTLLSTAANDGGLRGQYFNEPSFAGAASMTFVDPEISTAQLYRRWRAAVPESFGVQWSGYFHVAHSGSHTFSLTSEHDARLYIDRRLVVSIERAGDVVSRTGETQLAAGPHAVLLQYAHDRGARYLFEWSWAPPGKAASAVPSRTLSVVSDSRRVAYLPALDALWWLATAGLLLVLAVGLLRVAAARTTNTIWLAARVALLVALSWFYVAAATKHAQDVNTMKARADQSGYLWDAEQVYANFSGRTPPMLIGERARMPVYAAYLSLFYTPRLTDPEFFEVAKIWNIRLSVILLAALCVIFAYELPPLISLNLSLVVAFGLFVFKAGYSQPELLFYFFFFVTFLGCWHLLGLRDGRRSVWLGIATGGAAGLAYLTKALVPPFLAIFLFVFAIQEIAILWRDARDRAAAATRRPPIVKRPAFARFLWRMLAAAALACSFLAVVSPYILNNKRFFGEYFFNLNTTYYLWYDSGVEARIVVAPDHLGHPGIPREQMPTAASYWRSHTIGAMALRVRDGLIDLAARSYDSYGYLKYLIVYAGVVLLLVLSNRNAFAALVRDHWALALFLLIYAAAYLPATAFFVVTSGTGGMRFLLAHATPLFFALSRLVARQPFAGTRWNIRGLRLTAADINVLILAFIGFDLTFLLWRRLMTTYAGF